MTRTRCHLGAASTGIALLLGLCPATLWAQHSPPQPTKQTRIMVTGANYSAGAFKKLVFGNAYRDIWTLPIEVGLLDLDRKAGGLEPLRRVGGLHTAGFALRGADARSYTFRGVAKDPTLILPAEL